LVKGTVILPNKKIKGVVGFEKRKYKGFRTIKTH
jgi:hypothetical protein